MSARMTEKRLSSIIAIVQARTNEETGSSQALALLEQECARAREAELMLATAHHEARQEVVRLQQRIMELVDQDARYQAVDAAQHVVREWWKEAMGALPGPALELLLGRLQNIDLAFAWARYKSREEVAAVLEALAREE